MKPFNYLCSIFLLFVLFLPFNDIEARHLIGGELSYTCLGNDNYEISLEIFRDCNCVNCAPFDDPANIFIFNANGQTLQNISIFSPQIINVPLNTDGLCLENVPDVCVERGLYQTDVTLPSIPGGYQIVYQRCCRNETIVNLFAPSDQGNTYVISIPEVDSTDGDCQNSSPKFNNFPPILICANSPLVFDHSASDEDGDELVYSLCTPFQGASPDDPAPMFVSPPPYDPIVWGGTFSETNQLGGTPEITIDPSSGELRAFPDASGQYVVGICVSEYRDGVLLSQNIRDFQFNVEECDIVLADITVDIDVIGEAEVCMGDSFQLESSIFGADTFVWSPFTGLDNPNILNPTILSVTEPTTYVLIATDFSTGCEDVDTITVFPVMAVADAGTNMTTCSNGSVQLEGSGGESYLWTPDTGLDDATSSSPVATPSQTTTYILTVTSGPGCEDTAEVTVFVVDDSDPGNVSGDLEVICDGDAISVTHSGFGLNNGDVGAYVLHTNSDNALGGVIAANTNGTFSLSDNPNILPNTIYYLSPIAGPEGLMAGLPNFEDVCTSLSEGTPVVFLSPISYFVDEFCDLNTGDYLVSVQLIGGYPSFDNNFSYEVSGDFQGTFSFNEVFTAIFPESGMNSYEFNISDDCGSVLLSGDPFECAKNPVELLNFEGEVQVNGNLLQWMTASESNNAHFTIARSTDGKYFEEITRINSIGDSQTIEAYAHLDRTAPNGLVYYQLSQTDLNGLIETLVTISLQRGERTLLIERIYPVPSEKQVNIHFQAPTSGSLQLEVLNIHGQSIYQTTSSIQSGLNELSLDVNQWTEGVYILQMEMAGEQMTTKIVVR
ncbi:MAG: T9SS type A sorting domain-containing protein [Chitinophagales bacterium]